MISPNCLNQSNHKENIPNYIVLTQFELKKINLRNFLFSVSVF